MKKLLVCLFLLVSSVAQATVNTTINSITYTGNGATTNFSFSFAYPGAASSAASDFSVTTVVSGVTTVLPTNSYAITFNSPVSPNPTGIGGSVLYPLSGPALVNGATLTITRTLPAIQGTSLSNQGILYPPTLEQEYDYLTMLIQQGLNSFNRAVVGPVTDPAGLNYILPAVAARAGELLCFDSLGNITACTVLPSGTVSSAMQPVVSAATLAAGRTAFGLGTAAILNQNCQLLANASAAGNLDVGSVLTQVSTNQSVAAANCGSTYVATGPITFTLPRANTLWNGFGFWVNNIGGGDITVVINANDTITGLSSGTSGNIYTNSWAYITTDAASSGNWRISNTPNYPGWQPGMAMMWPKFNQLSLSTTVPWNAVDPWGRPINCAGTTSECLQEFQHAVAANGWSGRVECGGIPYTGSPTSPSWVGGSQFVIQATTSVNFAVAQDMYFAMHGCVLNFVVTTVPGLVVDSCGSCFYDLDVVPVYTVTTPNAGSCAIYIHPITHTADGFAGLYAGEFRVKAPVAAGVGGNAQATVCMNLDTAGVANQKFSFDELNCSHTTSYGLLIYNATSLTQFAGNQFHINEAHGCVLAGVQVGLIGSATAMLTNQWYIGEINSFGATSRGIDTYGSLDTWNVSNINNSEGGLQYGFVTEVAANNNYFQSGTVNGASTSAKLDTGTSNMWVGAQVGTSCTGFTASAIAITGIITHC